MHVYVDEAGDLGFKDTSTKFFIVASIVCESPIQVRTELRKVLKSLHKNKNKYHYSKNELKFTRMNQNAREYVLQKIEACDLNVNVVVVEKEKVYSALRNNISALYNYVTVHYIVQALLPQMVNNRRTELIFDKALSKLKIEEFNSYVKAKTRYFLSRENVSFTIDNMSLAHVNSIYEPGLQAADAIAGAYFQKYENNNSTYADIIADKVSSFNYLWKE